MSHSGYTFARFLALHDFAKPRFEAIFDGISSVFVRRSR